jgi:DNA invertase Pin-like site-specific DNA recombinase
MKVVIYTRVSTISQDVERQSKELLDYCKYKGYEVVREFTETVSGSKTRIQRVEMSKLMDFIEKTGDINGVLVWELSRLGRNTLDVLEILSNLTERKIWVYSKKDNLCTLNEDGTESPTTKLTLTLLSGISTLERETIISRSVSGLRNAVDSGNWLGGKYLPYGYRRLDKKLVEDEEEKKVVELIFNLYISGEGTKKIANELNRRKIPTRFNKSVTKTITINGIKKNPEDFKWRDGTIYSILTNPTYIGKKIGKGKIEGKPISSPVLIDEDIFKSVQFKLTNTPKTKRKKFFYLFDNQLRCGVCNRSYFPHKRESMKDNRFICLSKRYNESCCNYGISITKLSNAVWSLLRHNTIELQSILQNNSNKEELEQKVQKHKIRKEEVIKEQKVIEKKEKNIVNLLLDDKIDRKLYDEYFSSINNEKRNLKGLIEETDSEIASLMFLLEKQSDINRQLRNIKDDARLLKKAIQNVVERVVIYPVMQDDFPYLVNKSDKFIYVEVFTFINNEKPLRFCISQRSKDILFPTYMEYEKTSYSFVSKESEEEEEEGEGFEIMKLYHLSSLDRVS